MKIRGKDGTVWVVTVLFRGPDITEEHTEITERYSDILTEEQRTITFPVVTQQRKIMHAVIGEEEDVYFSDEATEFGIKMLKEELGEEWEVDKFVSCISINVDTSEFFTTYVDYHNDEEE